MRVDRLLLHNWETHSDLECEFKVGLNGIVGSNGCIQGSTELFDPVSGLTRRVDAIDAPFHVIAYNNGRPAIAKAGRPFVKGYEPMYEVATSQGRITVTAKHRFLTVNGYRRLEELSCGDYVLTYAVDGMYPTAFQLARGADARRYWQTTQDSQSRYFEGYHPCDGQPPWGVDIDPGVAPLQDGALKHKSFDYRRRAGVSACKSARNHLRQFAVRHAKNDSAPGRTEAQFAEFLSRKALSGGSRFSYRSPTLHRLSRELAFEPRSRRGHVLPQRERAEDTCSSAAFCCEQPEYPAFGIPGVAASLKYPVSGIVPRSGTYPARQGCAPGLDLSESALASSFSVATILSINEVGARTVWDLEVPGYQNYLAQGFVNHNSGKSSILRALSFALLGELQGYGVKADYLKHGADEGYVTVWFSHSGKQYQLKRYIHQGKQVLSCGSDRWTRNDEIVKLIEDMTGSSAEALVNNVFIPQGQIDAIFTASNTERLREFQRTFGLNKAETAYTALGVELGRHRVTPGLAEQVVDCRAALEVIARDKQVAAEAVAEEEAGIDALRPLEAKYRQAQEAKAALAALADSEVRVAEAKAALAEAESSITDDRRKVEALRVSLQSVRALSEEAQARLQLIATTRMKLQQCRKYQDELGALVVPVFDVDAYEAHMKVVSDLQQADQQAKAELASKGYLRTPELEEAQAQLTQAQLLLSATGEYRSPQECYALDHRAREIESHLGKFGEGICPTCGQAVKDFDKVAMEAEYQDILRRRTELEATARLQWESQVQQAKQLIQIIRTRVDALAEEAKHKAEAAARESSELFQAAVVKGQFLQSFKAVYESKLARKKQLTELVQEYGDLTLPPEEEIQSLTRAIAHVQALQTELTALDAGLSVKEAALRKTQLEVTKAIEARDRIGAAAAIPAQEELELYRQAAEKVFARTQCLRALRDKLAILEVKLVEHESSYRRLSEQLAKEAKLASWLDICTRARAAVHPNGLPALMMREYTAVLNRRIQKYLSLWDAPFKLYLDDNMAFTAAYYDGCVHSAARLSGGQKIVASASFRLAMADTFAARAGMLVLDEPSVYLDQDSILYLQKLLLRLKEYSGAAGKQIFLVTHEQSLTGFFDHIIRVHRTQG